MPERYRYYKRKLYFSTKDRILLHLLDFVGYEDEFSLPDEMTQFGIADAIGLGRSTVSKAIRRLLGQGLVRGARAHVPSGKLRRTVYVLTEKGVTAGNKRRREIEEEVILFRDASGTERKLRVGDVPKLVPEYATLLDVATHVSEGVFIATTFEGKRAKKLVDMTDRVPRLRYFFGRREELAAMQAWLESPSEKVLAVSGITGIGKTTLLSRKIEDWKQERHVLFHRIMPWTTARNVAQQLAEFLTRLGKKNLAQYLEAKQNLDVEEVVTILAEDLQGVPAIIVYDDYHNADPTIQNVFYGLRAALEGEDGVKLVVAGRSVPPFYDRRDVRVKGLVREISLAGLDAVSSEQLLTLRNLGLRVEEIRALHRKTGGHPLFLELVDSASADRAVDIHKYLEEELFSRITDAESRTLKVASVFRYPVHADALFIDDTVDAMTVRHLLEQSLLQEVSVKVYEVHDVVRNFFLDMLTPQERKRYNRWAAQFLLGRSDPDPLEALYHLIAASEVTGAARLAVREGRAMIKAGHSEDLLRLLDLLIPGISEPAHAAELQLLKARALDVRGELDQAVALYGEILRLESQPDLQAKAADAHRYLGDILRRGGQLDSADQHLEAALRVYKSLNHGEGQAEALLAVGQLAEDRADYPRAERLYERTIELARTLGLRDREAEAHFAFSRLLSIRGDPLQSLERKRRALALAEGLADWHLQARFQVALGTNLYELKRYEEAVLAYEQGIETARRIGDLRMLAYGVYNASLSFLTAGDHQRAESHLKEADVLFRKLREPVMAGLVLLNYGYLWEKREKWQLAKQNFLSGLRSLRDGGHDLDFARHALTVAGYMQKYGEHEAAIGIAQDALAVSRQLRIPSLADRAERFISEEEETSRRAGARRDVNDVATS